MSVMPMPNRVSGLFEHNMVQRSKGRCSQGIISRPVPLKRALALTQGILVIAWFRLKIPRPETFRCRPTEGARAVEQEGRGDHAGCV